MIICLCEWYWAVTTCCTRVVVTHTRYITVNVVRNYLCIFLRIWLSGKFNPLHLSTSLRAYCSRCTITSLHFFVHYLIFCLKIKEWEPGCCDSLKPSATNTDNLSDCIKSQKSIIAMEMDLIYANVTSLYLYWWGMYWSSAIYTFNGLRTVSRQRAIGAAIHAPWFKLVLSSMC